MENFQHKQAHQINSDKAMVFSPIGQFSTLAGEAQILNDTDSQHSNDSGTMKDYLDSFIEVQTQKLNKLEKTSKKRSSKSRFRDSSKNNSNKVQR